MLPLSLHIQYEEKVIDLLKHQFSSEIDSNSKLLSHYYYKKKERVYEFDMVQLDEHNQKIKKVFEIKTKKILETNFNSIKNKLQQYRNATKAEVYLVYLENDAQLQIVSLSDLRYNEKEETVPEVTSFLEFCNLLKQRCSGDDAYLRYFFRGHSQKNKKLVPSVYRNNNIKFETLMFHEAVRRNSYEFTTDMSTFDQLVKMQHYELPTRLLDITTNPLVALYFACKEHEDIDGEFFIFSMMEEQIQYYDSDEICILSNLAKCPIESNFTREKERLVYNVQQDKHNFNGGDLNVGDTKKVLCVLPKLNNERIIRQQGAFFVFGMGDESKKQPAELTDKPTKIIISAKSKKEILSDLQILGINEAVLFPETDKIMKQIKKELSRSSS